MNELRPIQKNILEFLSLNSEFLIIGGHDKLLRGEVPRDIDIYCILDQFEAHSRVIDFFRNLKLNVFVQKSPYSLLQYYIVDDASNAVELMDVIFELDALRSRYLFPDRNFEVQPATIMIANKSIQYDAILIAVKNVYKPLIVGKFKKYQQNKAAFCQVFGDVEIKNSTVTVHNRSVILKPNYSKWISKVIVERLLNIYLVNFKNVILVSDRQEAESITKLLSGEIDYRIIKGFRVDRPFKQSRTFLGFQVPISALKVTIVVLPRWVDKKVFKKSNYQRNLEKFLGQLT